MTVARRALELIEHFEGYHRELPDGRAAPYLCPANVPTIGIGATFYEGGRRVTLADPPITRDRAYELLGYELRQCEAAVDRQITRRQPDLSRGALVSFAFNCGTGALKGSTLRRKVNASDVAGAAREFLKWTMAGGVRLRGLERRRQAESALFLAGHKGERDDAAPARNPAHDIDSWRRDLRVSGADVDTATTAAPRPATPEPRPAVASRRATGGVTFGADQGA